MAGIRLRVRGFRGGDTSSDGVPTIQASEASDRAVVEVRENRDDMRRQTAMTCAGERMIMPRTTNSTRRLIDALRGPRLAHEFSTAR